MAVLLQNQHRFTNPNFFADLNCWHGEQRFLTERQDRQTDTHIVMFNELYSKTHAYGGVRVNRQLAMGRQIGIGKGLQHDLEMYVRFERCYVTLFHSTVLASLSDITKLFRARHNARKTQLSFFGGLLQCLNQVNLLRRPQQAKGASAISWESF